MRVLILVVLVVAGCAPAPAPSPSSSSSGTQATWQPTETQKVASVELVRTYFAALRADRIDEAYAMFLPLVASRMSAEQLRAANLQTRKRYGARQDVQIRQVGWLPRGSNTGMGVAAVVEFDGLTDRDAIFCGKAAIAEMAPGQFKVYGVEETSVERDRLAQLDTATRRQLLDRPGCTRFLTTG